MQKRLRTAGLHHDLILRKNGSKMRMAFSAHEKIPFKNSLFWRYSVQNLYVCLYVCYVRFAA